MKRLHLILGLNAIGAFGGHLNNVPLFFWCNIFIAATVLFVYVAGKMKMNAFTRNGYLNLNKPM